MTDSIQLAKYQTPNVKNLMSNIKLDKKKNKVDWNLLFEDIVNINFNNRAEIFHYLLEKLDKHKRYFSCGFDLFHLNDFNSSIISDEAPFNLIETEKEKKIQIGASLKWLSKSHTVKPKHSSLYSFLAFLVKNYSLSKEKQMVLIQGPKSSGKSSQLIKALDFFDYLNKMEFISGSDKQRKRCESIQKPSQLTITPRPKAISTNKEPKLISELREESLQVNVMNMKSSVEEDKIFAGKQIISFLKKAVRIINLFINSIGSTNRRTSNAVLSVEIKLEESSNFCLLRLARIKLNFLMDHLMENKWLGGFESFYAFLSSSKETFLNAYNLSKNPQNHFGLFFNASLKSKMEGYKKEWEIIEELFPPKYLKGLQKMMCSILTLINFNSETVEKEIGHLSILLEVEKEILEEYFKADTDEQAMSARDKQKEYKRKGKIMAKILYRLILDSLITFLNVQMFEIYRLTCKEGEFKRNTSFDIELVDFLGYSDKDSCIDNSSSKSRKENGKYEFQTNWLNEKMFNFYSKSKFERSDMTEEEKVNYVKNDDILENIETGQNSFLSCMIGKSFEEAKTILDEHHLVFLKKAMNLLNQSQMRTTSLAEEEYFIEIGHFFKESVNYDLRALYELTQPQSFNVQQFWTDIVCNSKNWIRPENWDIKDIIISPFVQLKYDNGKKNTDWKQLINNKLNDIMIQSDSDIDDFLFEWDEFIMEFTNNQNVYFLNCLKVEKISDPKDKEQELYKTFEGVDFESLINYYKQCFSVKYSYEFFYKKFGLEDTVSVFLGERVALGEVEELKRVTRNMLEFVLPSSGEFKLEQDYLKIKHGFFDQMEKQLKKIKNNKVFRKIITEMLLVSFRAKIKANKPNAFALACKFINKLNRMSVWDKVLMAKEKFMKIAERVRDRKRDEESNKNLKDMAREYLEDIVDQLMEEQVIKIQSLFRMKKAKNLLKNLKLENEKKKDKEKELTAKRDKVEAMMVLQSFYENSELLEFFRLRKVFLMKIFKFLRNVQFKMNINKRISEKRKLRLMSKMQETQTKIIDQFMNDTKTKCYLGEDTNKPIQDSTANCSMILPSTPNKNFISSSTKIRCAIMGIHMQDVETSSNMNTFCDNLSSTFNRISQQKDSILNISMQNNFCLVNTVKQSLFIFSLNEPDLQLEISLPFKILSVFYFNELLYVVDESKKLRVKYVPFGRDKQEELESIYNSETGSKSNYEEEATFIFAKFKEIQFENGLFVGSTECDKLCVKSDLSLTESPLQIFQFKRMIKKISCGNDFMMVLDKDGVLYGNGANRLGQLGQGHCEEVDGLVPVHKLSYRKAIIKSFSCGAGHVIAATGNNHIYSWGDNTKGQVNPFFLENGISKMEIIDQPIKVFDSLKEILKGEHKIQLCAGNYSSWVLTSNSKLFMFGQLSQYKEEGQEQIRKWDLHKLYGKSFMPISLHIEKNNDVELVYFRFLDSSIWKSTKMPKLKILHKNLFIKSIETSSSLLEFSDTLARHIDLAFMTNKIIEVSNKKHNQVLQMEKQRTWNFMMLSSKFN